MAVGLLLIRNSFFGVYFFRVSAFPCHTSSPPISVVVLIAQCPIDLYIPTLLEQASDRSDRKRKIHQRPLKIGRNKLSKKQKAITAKNDQKTFFWLDGRVRQPDVQKCRWKEHSDLRQLQQQFRENKFQKLRILKFYPVDLSVSS